DPRRRRRDRQERGAQHRAGQAVRPDEVRERREDGHADPAQDPADELERNPDTKDAPKPSPVRTSAVPEAVLDHRLVDGEVGEELEEARRGEDEREQAEVVRAELPERDDAAEEPERGGEVHAGRGRGSAPEDRRAHDREASIERRSVGSRAGPGPRLTAEVYPPLTW